MSKLYSVSQNFLTSAKTIRRLLRLTNISKNDHIVEIGAGKGHITRELIGVCKRVDAYEIDRGLCEKLHKKFENTGNLSIRQQDFLKSRLPKDAYKVFANIPFSITSDIIRRLTGPSGTMTDAWLVMEKGAAKRFLGTPRETSSSLLLKPYFDGKVIYHFSRGDFHPMPSVDTVLVHFSRREEPDIKVREHKEYARFVRQGIQRGVRHFLTKRQIDTALRRESLPEIGQSETMLYVQWLCLFRCWRRLYGAK